MRSINNVTLVGHILGQPKDNGNDVTAQLITEEKDFKGNIQTAYNFIKAERPEIRDQLRECKDGYCVVATGSVRKTNLLGFVVLDKLVRCQDKT